MAGREIALPGAGGDAWVSAVGRDVVRTMRAALRWAIAPSPTWNASVLAGELQAAVVSLVARVLGAELTARPGWLLRSGVVECGAAHGLGWRHDVG
jgi:hypothetical protein